MELTAGELAASVADVLGRDPSTVAILARRRNVQTSTWPSEILDCRVGDDGRLRLLLKHGPGDSRNAHGHPVGPAYEAMVYETVLAPAGLAHPFLGSVHPPGSHSMCLVLEYLDRGWWRMNLAEDLRAIVRVAAWLGAFHGTATARAGALAGALNVYDAELLRGLGAALPVLCPRPAGTVPVAGPGLPRLRAPGGAARRRSRSRSCTASSIRTTCWFTATPSGRWTGSGPRWPPARSTSPR